MSQERSTVRVAVNGRTRTGRAVDLRDADVGREVIARAISASNGDESRVVVDCPAPHPVFEHVGVVHPEVTVAPRTALAAAGRSRGLETPHDDAIASLRERLTDGPTDGAARDGRENRDHEAGAQEHGNTDASATRPADPAAARPADPAAARRRLAGTESEVERHRERVATLRGRLAAAREAGRATADLESDLADAAAALAEAETERAAAREALERAERRVRELRDARERERERRDRLANLERDARAHLVARLREPYAAAVADLDGETTDPFAVGDVTAALAVARVAALRVPVVLACDRFADPTAGAEWLDGPVVRV